MTFHPSMNEVRVTNFVLKSVAIVLTFLRLFDRTRTGRLWWDDVWALITMLFLVASMACTEVHLQNPEKHSMSVKIAVYLMAAQLFYAVVWSARLSILLTVIRLAVGQFRRFLVYTAMVFVLIWLILFAQIWWICEGNTKWKENFDPQCPLRTDVAVAQLITDVICDAILIFAPLHLVWRSKLSGAQRIRLTVLFSTTFILTAVSLTHAYFILKVGGSAEVFAGVLEASLSLIVANLSVIIAFFFRIKTEDSEYDTTEPSHGRTTFFTFSKRVPAVPITSTFEMTNGDINERGDGYSMVACKKDHDGRHSSTGTSRSASAISVKNLA